jgi:hypothetical protein
MNIILSDSIDKACVSVFKPIKIFFRTLICINTISLCLALEGLSGRHEVILIPVLLSGSQYE